MKITKKQATKIVMRAAANEYEWNECIIGLYDKKSNSYPDVYDVLEAFGVTEEEAVHAWKTTMGGLA